MRIEIPREAERFGANLFYGLQKVYELDSGLSEEKLTDTTKVVERVSYQSLHEIESNMVIVIPIRNEQIKLLEGVLFGIPHQCFIIIVSNSHTEPVDRFTMEVAAIENFGRFTQKNIMLVHQKDPQLSKAFQENGYDSILDDAGIIKNGKAEGMLLGTLLAKLSGRKYIGFIDADNYFPGAVHEYVRIYSAGLSRGQSNYTMVRISWHSKPKIVASELFFAKWGRTSVSTNRFLNELLSHYTGFETEVIKTGNAGEHAMTIDLAMLLGFAADYSIEPYHFIDLLEKFGGINKSPYPEVMQKYVEIFQIESRNPHLHEQKGNEHVDNMIYDALQVIYHSSVTPDSIKNRIMDDLQKRELLNKELHPDHPKYYPELANIDLATFVKVIKDQPYAKYIGRDFR